MIHQTWISFNIFRSFLINYKHSLNVLTRKRGSISNNLCQLIGLINEYRILIHGISFNFLLLIMYSLCKIKKN